MKKYFQTFFPVLFFIFFACVINARQLKFSPDLISGIVLNDSTMQPVENVNIYLAYTMLGTTSDKEGKFSLKNVPQGSYVIIFSHVGFERKTLNIEVGGKNIVYTVLLKRKVYELETVSVVSDIDDWKDNLELFKERLIGTSTFAQKVELVNPTVINFSKNKAGNLTASSPSPLEFINRALGYKIIYYLDYFEADNFITKYSGMPYFSELKPENSSIQKEWEKNRNKAYMGSLRHFLTLVCQNYDSTKYYENLVDSLKNTNSTGSEEFDNFSDKLEYFSKNNFIYDNGFRILKIAEPNHIYELNNFVQVSINNFLEWNSALNKIYFKNLKGLSVRYSKENPDINYIDYEQKQNVQFPPTLRSSRISEDTGTKDKFEYPVSTIDVLGDKVFIDRRGKYFDKFMIRTYGYWGFERLAETLPYEYEPD